MPQVRKPTDMDLLAVLVTDEMHKLAKSAGEWGNYFGVTKPEKIWPDKLRAEISAMPWGPCLQHTDSSHLWVCQATVKDKGLCAIGVGTSTKRIEKATLLALAVSAALRMGQLQVVESQVRDSEAFCSFCRMAELHLQDSLPKAPALPRRESRPLAFSPGMQATLAVPQVTAISTGRACCLWECAIEVDVLPGVELEQLVFADVDQEDAIERCKERCEQLGFAGFSIDHNTARLKPWEAIAAQRVRSPRHQLFLRQLDAGHSGPERPLLEAIEAPPALHHTVEDAKVPAPEEVPAKGCPMRAKAKEPPKAAAPARKVALPQPLPKAQHHRPVLLPAKAVQAPKPKKQPPCLVPPRSKDSRPLLPPPLRGPSKGLLAPKEETHNHWSLP